MGGRALKNTYTRRYDKKEFLALKDEVIDILNKDFKYKTVPLYYTEKETFGDLDVVVSWEKGGIDDGTKLVKYIEETFKPNEIFHTSNSNSWSFDYKNCQVDFIMCDEENFWCHYHYFAYNDLGNFIGVLARNIGLKYGQEGLFYDHYFKGKNVGRVNVSKDYIKIFSYLDLDYIRFMMGFKNLEEIFEYIKTSKYFDSERYQLDKLNKINRERNLKRTSYVKMLAYIKEHPKDVNFAYVEDKTPYIAMADKFFSEFNYTEETRRMEYEVCKDLYIKSKFNGRDVLTKYPQLTGKQLGDALTEFKNSFDTHEGYYEYILKSPKECVMKDFEDEILSKVIDIKTLQ